MKSRVTNYEQYSAFSGGPAECTEIWKPINNYEKLYEVSNFGRVRSLDKVVDRGKYGLHLHRGKILTPTDNGYGYLIVSLRGNDRKRKNHYIHRLVAETFLSNPECKTQVNHLDHNRTNNKVNNLEWVTRAENIQYSAHLLRHPRMNNKNTNKTYGTGIRFKNQKYEVYICHKYLGRFFNLADAQKVRDEYVKKYYDKL